MTQVYDPANAAAQNQAEPACERSAGCEFVVQMGSSLDLLRQENQELRISLAELDRQASTDKLTGAWNRRRLEETVVIEMKRLKRYVHPLSLLVVDVDRFKRVNDRYGHSAGDRLLVNMAARIRSALRSTDSLTRWGGEEFVVLCPDTVLATAAVLAERLRAAIAHMDNSVAEKITVSTGAAECLPEETWGQWFGRADAMLLQAKAAGRNQARIATEVPLRTEIAETDPAGFLCLVWHRSYASGHEILDREHEALFGSVNELFAAILSGRPMRETSAFVDSLIRGVSRHFQDEESVIAAAGYPDVTKHAAMHRALIARAFVLAERFRAGEVDVGALFQFIAHELIARHILRADRDFFPYLQSETPRAGRGIARALAA